MDAEDAEPDVGMGTPTIRAAEEDAMGTATTRAAGRTVIRTTVDTTAAVMAVN